VVDGIAEACRAFETPITGGNVSFYNETFNEDIYPTPVLGVVGIVEDLRLVTPSTFRADGDRIILLERPSRDLKINLDDERALQNLVAGLIRDARIVSAHDLSEGGLAVGLAECCFSTLHRGAIGAWIDAPSRMEVCRDLFAEFPTRILVSTGPDDAAQVLTRASNAGLAGNDLGSVGGSRCVVRYEGAVAIDAEIADLEQCWRDGLSGALENRPLFE
jgi:phosphoribosylformylglycinamidine synthase